MVRIFVINTCHRLHLGLVILTLMLGFALDLCNNKDIILILDYNYVKLIARVNNSPLFTLTHSFSQLYYYLNGNVRMYVNILHALRDIR